MPPRHQSSRARRSKPKPDEAVSFTVVCQTPSGVDFEKLRMPIGLDSLVGLLPTDATLVSVSATLRSLGFSVFPIQSPVLSVRTTVGLFEEVFGVKLVRIRQSIDTGLGRRVVASLVAEGHPNEVVIPVSRVPGALRIILAQPPTLVAPRLPPPPGRKSPPTLRVPGDIAQITTASLVHRHAAGGRGATGFGIGLAIVDSGFAYHPWFDDHAFDITRVASGDTADPEVDDDDPHGTLMLAPLLSCAPDASVLAVKFGEDFKLAFDLAANAPGVRVISLSLTFPQSGIVLSEAAAGLVLPILSAIGRGITVVAAAGNGDEAFPAMMPEVIAVGGLEIGRDDGLQHWPLSSSFTSPIYPGRPVPDVCGLASQIQFPTQGGNQWDASLGGTSAATTQVAGVAALLLEKKPALTPAQVRNALMATAKPVGGGKAGAGIVDAKAAWDSV